MYYILKEYSAVGKPTRYQYSSILTVQIFLDYCYLQDKKYSVKNLFSSLEKHSNKLLFFATRDNTAGKLISDESDVKTCPGKDVVENDILDDWIVISPKKAETIG